MLTKSGAKLLDFGLAKPAAPLGNPATLTAMNPLLPVTEQGTVVGTFQYMSPEQVEGKELDARSDIFSLGAVLYEMLTGQRAFEGKSQLSVASAILEKDPPPIGAVKPKTPPALDRAIKKCLAKIPDERWQSTSDLADELKWISQLGEHTGPTTALASAGKFRERLSWLISGALALLLIAAAVWWRNSKPLEQTMYFAAPMSVPAYDIAVAPDGHTIAVGAYLESARKNALWIYELGGAGARVLADTEGARYPFWSADGRYLGFFADGKLKKLELSGGQVQTVCDAPFGRGGTWNKDDVIVFAPSGRQGSGLYRVSASGGTAKQISNPDKSRGEDGHRWPMFLPDGIHYLYMAANFSGRKDVDAIFVGSLDSNEKHFVVETTANAAFAPPGYLLFYRDKTLLTQQFDPKRFALAGEPTTVFQDIQYLPQMRHAVFAVSNTGLLVAQSGSEVALSQPLWFDRNGRELGAVGQPGVYGNVSLASNGRSVAVEKSDIGSQSIDIWTYDSQRASAKRLTFGPF